MVSWLTGCWDLKEIDNLSIVMVSAVDIAENGSGIKITSQVAVPAGGFGSRAQGQGGASQQGYTTFSAEGKNIHDTMQQLQRIMSRQLFIAHRRVLLIGESLAEKGIKELLDHYTRDPESRLQTYVLITKGSNAGALLHSSVPFETVPGEAVRELVRSKLTRVTTLGTLVNDMVEEGIEPTIGAIELVSRTTPPETGTKEQEMKTFRLAGTAVFKEGKLTGYLNMPETRGLQWVRDDIARGTITGELPGGEKISMDLMKADRQLKVFQQDGHLKAILTVHAKGAVHENNSHLDLSQPANLKLAEEALNEIINKRITTVCHKAQKELKSDILGIGLELRRKHPSMWKPVKEDWEAQFTKVDIEVISKVVVTSPGMYGAPAQLKKEEIIK